MYLIDTEFTKIVDDLTKYVSVFLNTCVEFTLDYDGMRQQEITFYTARLNTRLPTHRYIHLSPFL
jgi:hypothetical protein